MTESQLKNKARKALLREFKDLMIMPVEDMFHKGYPDWLIVHRGKNIFIEWKLPKGKLSKMQEYFINQIKLCGGSAHVCRSVEDILNIIRKGG